MKKEKNLNHHNEDFLNDYEQLMSKKKLLNHNVTKEWVSKGDNFVKFSLFRESASGKTSSNSIMTKNMQSA